MAAAAFLAMLGLPQAQAGIIRTFAGGGTCNGATATAAALKPRGVTVDAAGTLYVSDTSNAKVCKLTSDGNLVAVAGNGYDGYSGDGATATAAKLHSPSGLALDSTGNLYIADSGNNVVRKVTPGGTISTVAGDGTPGDSRLTNGDGGAATSAQLQFPNGIAVDNDGNLYIADTSNHRIRKVTAADGKINSIAGTGFPPGFSGDGGPATAAKLNRPEGIALDTNGNVYIADTGNARVRRVAAADGTISTVSAFGTSLSLPASIAIRGDGTMAVADAGRHMVVTLTTDGTLVRRAGMGTAGFNGDGGDSANAQLDTPQGVAWINDAVYVADTGNNRVRVAFYEIRTVAGNGNAGVLGDGGPALSGQLNQPWGIASDNAGRVFIADTDNDRVRMVAADGTITTVASSFCTGSGEFRVCDSLNKPGGVAYHYDDAVNGFPDYVVIADSGNNRIRKAAFDGTFVTLAGTGSSVYGGDGGPAISAGIYDPIGVAVDFTGAVFVADAGNDRVRMIDGPGTIRTIAGNGVRGYSGDNGPATSAQLNSPRSVAFDSSHNVYIADTVNRVVRKFPFSGGSPITTVAGNGKDFCGADGGPATATAFSDVSSIAIDGADNLYIVDSLCNVVRKVTADGKIQTFAGNRTRGYSGDGGLATRAWLQWPRGVVIGTGISDAGYIYIADTGNNVIRVVTPSYTVGGAVSGLAGNNGGLVLSLNGVENLPIAADGSFMFQTELDNAASYAVTVSTQPNQPLQVCSVTANGSGTINKANVTNVAVTCKTNTYTVGGSVSGLVGSGLTLSLNGGAQTLPISANGAFTFPAALNDGSAYEVGVQTLPSAPAQACTIINPSGTMVGANVTNVTVTCSIGTATTLVANPTRIRFGQSVQFLATVSAIGGGIDALPRRQAPAARSSAIAAAPTGSVTFYEGAIALGTSPLAGASATLSTTTLAVGAHVVIAKYSGDSSFPGSTSNAVTVEVVAPPVVQPAVPAPALDRIGLACLLLGFAAMAWQWRRHGTP